MPLIPELERDYADHRVDLLGTVHCRPWSFANRVLLVGDAAHVIVPFHGQGMNAAFEDCAVRPATFRANRLLIASAAALVTRHLGATLMNAVWMRTMHAH